VSNYCIEPELPYNQQELVPILRDLLQENKDIAEHYISTDLDFNHYYSLRRSDKSMVRLNGEGDASLAIQFYLNFGLLRSTVFGLAKPTPQQGRKVLGLIPMWRAPCLTIASLATLEICKVRSQMTTSFPVFT